MRGTTFIRDLKSIIIRQLKVLVIIILIMIGSDYLLDIINISTTSQAVIELVLSAIMIKLAIVPSDLVKIHTNYSNRMRFYNRD